MQYDPFDLMPPKALVKNAVEQLNAQASALLQSIRDLRQNELADWLVENLEREHRQLVGKINRYRMYIEGVEINKDWEEAKLRAKRRPIADLYVGQLRKTGKLLKGKCPFHEDQSPSFLIYPNNSFHCFGCQANGDSIAFIMKRDSLDFKEAVKLLNL